MDLVDHYLKEKHNITLSYHNKSSDLRSAGIFGGKSSQKSPEKSYGNNHKDQQTKVTNSVLDNPVYKKMPFYPYKDLLMWQEVEA